MSRVSSVFLRRVVAGAITALAIATATQAAADDRADRSGVASAAFSSLPSGKVPLPPKSKTPATIGANEKVAGFFFAGPKGRADYVTLVSSAKAAKQMMEGTRGDGSEGRRPSEACFTEREQNGMRRFDDTEEAWRGSLQSSLGMSASTQHGQRPVVTAVHSERVADEDGRPSLEIIDAWIDPMTRGARLIGRSTVPLVLLSTLFEGTKIYALRDAETVHVILVPSRDRKRTGHEGLFATADTSLVQSGCDHIRATLKTEKGQGQTASFVASVELPSLDKEAPETKEAKEAREVKEAKADPMAAFRASRPRTELRTRPVHVQASVTWASRDKDALVSVSAGWDSRERVTPVF
jgi:hypothetical protein